MRHGAVLLGMFAFRNKEGDSVSCRGVDCSGGVQAGLGAAQALRTVS